MKKILLVEDDKDYQQVLKEVLENANYQIDLSENGT